MFCFSMFFQTKFLIICVVSFFRNLKRWFKVLKFLKKTTSKLSSLSSPRHDYRGRGGGVASPSRSSPDDSFLSSASSSSSFLSISNDVCPCRLPRCRLAFFAFLVGAWMIVFFAVLYVTNSTAPLVSRSFYFGSSQSNSGLQSAINQLKELAKSQKEVENELRQIKGLLQLAASAGSAKSSSKTEKEPVKKKGDVEIVTMEKKDEDEEQNEPADDKVKATQDKPAADNCTFVPMDPRFPHCADKLKWMEAYWKSDKCYASFGVDGSHCSFHIFLSEIEHFCPHLPWRAKPSDPEATIPPDKLVSLTEMAPVDEIIAKLKEDRVSFIAQRIRSAWPMWQNAWKELFGPSSNTSTFYSHRRRRTIIVHLGFLTPEMERKWHMAETASKGGPLGEMVQWSDVIASIHALGHEIVLTYDKQTLQNILSERTHLSPTSCQANTVNVDLIYTDIVGYKQATSVLSQSGIKCRVRLLDSFGTEPAYNHEAYSKRFSLPGQWGRLGMNPKQFYTLFPHSPDNSFMGFVVSVPPPSNQTKRQSNSSLVYGKHLTMWQGREREDYIGALGELTHVHATVDPNPVSGKPGETLSKLPSWVVNHGVLPPSQFYDLLWSSQIFVGLGFPYEGPAPLEAIAAGCVFLNPSFNPPHSSLNTAFFKGKPTSRGLTSQNPYAEKAIGRPRVITVDMANLTAVRDAVREALNTEPSPFIPREFTAVGMLERLNAYIENQDLCSGEKPLWPPESSVQFVLGQVAESCIDTCEKKGLVCETTHFYRANAADLVKRMSNGVCKLDNTQPGQDVVYPVISKGECFLQEDMMLFSCAGADPSNQRVCPCRDFMPGQLALCKNCL